MGTEGRSRFTSHTEQHVREDVRTGSSAASPLHILSGKDHPATPLEATSASVLACIPVVLARHADFFGVFITRCFRSLIHLDTAW